MVSNPQGPAMIPNIPSNDFNDGWGCLADLRDALADSRLDEFLDVTPQAANETAFQASDEGGKAALRMAIALGFCRLFDVAVGELEGPLPVSVAVAAGLYLKRRLADESLSAEQL